MVAALAGVAFLAVPGSPGHRSLHEGLDLQGGLEVVLQAKPLKGQQLTSAMMDDSVSIMRNRVDKLGVSEPVITKQGTNQIVDRAARRCTTRRRPRRSSARPPSSSSTT